MKKEHVRISALLILTVLSVMPAHASAGTPDTVSLGTDVTCKVGSKYAFTLPRNTQAIYPQTQVDVGDFGIRNLLLETGEYLTVSLAPGPFVNQNNEPVAIPYTVDFHPPRTISERDIGDKYAITVQIASDAIGGADAGEYTAPLGIRIRSHPDGDVVWRGKIYITAVKPGESAVESTPAVRAASAPSPSPSPTATPEAEESPSGEASPQPDESQPGNAEEAIGDEPVPGAAVQGSGLFSKWWIWAVGAGLLALLFILTLMYGKRKKKKEA